MKCLPSSKISQANGIVIHDWHAEILVLRCLNHFLLSECHRLANNPDETSSVLRRRTNDELGILNTEGSHQGVWQAQPFTIKESVVLHMYCSEAPCGDASMELTMAAQEDAAPWDIPSANAGNDTGNQGTGEGEGALLGRGYFSQLGVVRRKPARADAPPTMSKSCSDKMALKQCSSMLSSLVTLFVHPGNAYISSVILPISQHSAIACERSFSAIGRMRALVGRTWAGGYAFRPFEVRTTELEFEYSRRSAQAKSAKIAASNMAAAWNAGGQDEALVNGVLHGRRATDVRGACSCSRRKLWALALETAAELDIPAVDKHLSASRYGEIKAGECLLARSRVLADTKAEALGGWVPNGGDESFQLEQGAT